jgi:hypothetical protein
MVISRLRGGLGNQMFQYAFGRHVALKRGDRLVLETSQLAGRSRATPRAYGLGMFDVTASLASPDDWRAASGVIVTIAQQRDGFHPDALAVCTEADVIIQGFWTSERYFIDIASVIRTELAFTRKTYQYTNERLAHEIPRVNAVCVHVRRGDYVSTPTHFMGFVGVEYYHRAIDLVAARVSHPTFFIFSDDIEWCNTHLTIDQPHAFVRHSRPAEDATEEDFRLMRACRHFIVGNSTFSWWAAWLSAGAEAVIVAPSKWYAQTALGAYQLDATQVVPEHWLRL